MPYVETHRQTPNSKETKFIEAILAVCKQHGLGISHEDEHGAFIIQPFEPSLEDWLRAAFVRYET